jgi:histidinol-phosphatase (PHP family)
MVPLDYHIHTRFSTDSQSEPEELCRRAIELGLPEIGFSEHWDVGPYEEVTRFLQPVAWWQELTRLRRLYEGQLTLRAGIEIAEPHLYLQESADMVAMLPFDYVLGSVHFVGPHMMFDEAYFRQHQADEIYESYFAELERMVRSADIDIVAHFDIPARTGIPIFGYEVRRYGSAIRTVLKVVVERGLALDVNTAGLRKPAGNLMPDPQILRWYRALDGERLTLGSDAHTVEQLGLNLEKALQVIREAGFGYLTRYEKRNPGKIPI